MQNTKWMDSILETQEAQAHTAPSSWSQVQESTSWKALAGPELDGPKPFWKKYQKVPIKIGMGITIAIGFVFLNFSLLGQAPNEKVGKNNANGNGNAHANFDWYFLLLFCKMVGPYLANPI